MPGPTLEGHVEGLYVQIVTEADDLPRPRRIRPDDTSRWFPAETLRYALKAMKILGLEPLVCILPGLEEVLLSRSLDEDLYTKFIEPSSAFAHTDHPTEPDRGVRRRVRLRPGR